MKQNIDNYSESNVPQPLLTGILTCKCGAALKPFFFTNSNGDADFVYACETCYETYGISYNGPMLDDLVIKQIEDDEPDAFNDHEVEVETHPANLHEASMLVDRLWDEKDELDESIESIEMELRGLPLDCTSDIVEYLQEQLKTLYNERNELVSDIAELRTAAANDEINEIACSVFKYVPLTADEKREIIRERVENVMLDGKKVFINTK